MPGIPAFRRLKQDRTARPHLKRQTVKQQPPAVCGAVITSTWEVRGGVSSSRSFSATREVQSQREREGGEGGREGGREGETLPQTNRTTTNSFHEHTGNMVLFPEPLAAQYETLRNKRAHILGRCVLPEASI